MSDRSENKSTASGAAKSDAAAAGVWETIESAWAKIAAPIKVVQRNVIRPLASLKITVTLLAMAIFLILAGTLAQTELNMWQVMVEYFYPWIAWVDLDIFRPEAFFPGRKPIPDDVWHWIPFPGGALIGTAMLVNLLSANFSRFSITARRWRLLGGMAVTAFGLAVTFAVVSAGHNQEGIQDAMTISPNALWGWIQGGIVVVWGVGAAMLWRLPEDRKAAKWMLSAFELFLGALFLFLIMQDPMSQSSMRILWQLLQGTLAGAVMLVGLTMLYKQRGAVVLIHAAVVLLMVGQMIVSLFDVESRMTIEEGQTTNYTRDIRSTELAVVDASQKDEDRLVSIPLHTAGRDTSFLRRALKGEAIDHESLPFRIKISEYFPNARLRKAEKGENSPVDAGESVGYIAEPAQASSGADSSGEVDFAAAYVQVLDKKSDKPIGTYLLTQVLAEQEIVDHVVLNAEGAASKEYEISLRFRRDYKPYSFHLIDVSKEDYMGTETPRSYSSELRLVDASRDEDRQVKIWMNNPLRYAGETFYQSGYRVDGRLGIEITDLQVVRNHGWMIPYVACMWAVVGMLGHFTLTLMRFMEKQRRQWLSEGVGVDAVIVQPDGSIVVKPRQPVPENDDSPSSHDSPESHDAPARSRRKGRGSARKERDAKRSKHDSSHPGSNQGGSNQGMQTRSDSNDARTRSAGLDSNLSQPDDRLFGLIPVWAASVVLSLGLVFVAGAFFVQRAMPPRFSNTEMNLFEAGRIPIMEGGRLKPFDTVARNAMRALTNNKETFRDKDDNKQTAIRWMLDVAGDSEAALEHRVFYINHDQVRANFALERRKGHLYSVNELLGRSDAKDDEQRSRENEAGRKRLAEFEAQVEAAKKIPAGQLDDYQRQILLLDRKMRTYTRLQGSFRPTIPDIPSEEELSKLSRDDMVRVVMAIRSATEAAPEAAAALLQTQPPLAVPSSEKDADWQPFSSAWDAAFQVRLAKDGEVDPPLKLWNEILTAYRDHDTRGFNRKVAEYHQWLEENRPADYRASGVRFESFFNNFRPFLWNSWLYLAAGVIVLAVWMVSVFSFRAAQPLNWATLALILLLFAVHTFAIAGRISISGRPPITNLYSSAIAVGWGCVLFGIVIELLTRIGVGNMIAAVGGFSTLLIADGLAADNDTMAVMQAVLDTQFWLSTHVVIIALGYVATFVAGALGLASVLGGMIAPLPRDVRRALHWLTYGVVCFAIFFSFVGTVLGGLWADDSWGRFWGWDPKENGALIIVLWNALILHARWDAIVKERGFALLAIGGGIVTAWSWFGVNELGVGLHSYGFTDGVLMRLALFAASQLAIIILALSIPQRLWISNITAATGRQEVIDATVVDA